MVDETIYINVYRTRINRSLILSGPYSSQAESDLAAEGEGRQFIFLRSVPTTIPQEPTSQTP